MPYALPFGKFKGKPITEVPDDYLAYLLKLDNLYPETKAEIEKEQARRRGGDGPATGHGRPVAKHAGLCPSCAKYILELVGGTPEEVPF